MKSRFSLRTFAVALAWLCAASGSAGLTLGRVQGLALIGQPLDLQVPVQFDTSEDAQSACLNAEVAYGDNPLDSTRVSVAVEPSSDAANRPARVRVRTTVPVNEPVVTVNLRSGCQVRSSRRYTLLADLPTQVVEPLPARAPALVQVPVTTAQPATSVPETRPAPQATPQRSTPSRKVQPAPVSTRMAPAITAPQPATAGAGVAPPARVPKQAKPVSRARLKLDPLDLLIERDPVLRATDELLSLPQEGGSGRAEAAALWAALNASPEQILREEAQAQRVAAELKALYTVTNQNQKGLIELAAKVEQAESGRYANGLVYTLAALCAAALVALVWMWQRMQVVQVVPDWRVGQDADDSLLAELLASKVHLPRDEPLVRPNEPSTTSRPSGPAPLARTPASTPVMTEVDFDLETMDAPRSAPAHASRPAMDPWAAPSAAAPSAWGHMEVPSLPAGVNGRAKDVVHGGIDFSISMSPSLRSIDTEELEDIRHQAEFFVSLGQHEKAVEILTTRIAQCGESSPLVCLDLLKIYHALGQEPEYTFMRAEFQHWFTGRVPEFADFGDEGRALDRYPQVMERIMQLWPGARVLEYIEDCLYHHTGTVDAQAFDLQAYRDLLLLHTVAKRILRMGSDSVTTDSHVTDVVRIPGRAQNFLMSDTPDSRRVPAHRFGAHGRGDMNTAEGLDGVDPQAEVETRGVPLGHMRVPPTAISEEDSPKPGGPVRSGESASLTDFNFLNLR